MEDYFVTSYEKDTNGNTVTTSYLFHNARDVFEKISKLMDDDIGYVIHQAVCIMDKS